MSYIDVINYFNYHKRALDLGGRKRTQLDSSGVCCIRFWHGLKHCISECRNSCDSVLKLLFGPEVLYRQQY